MVFHRARVKAKKLNHKMQTNSFESAKKIILWSNN